MRGVLSVSAALAVILTSSCSRKVTVVEEDITIDTIAELCVGDVLPHNLIPCSVASSLSMSVTPQDSYRCALVVASIISGKHSASYKSLSDEGAVAWASAFVSNRDSVLNDIDGLKRQFLNDEVNTAYGLSEASVICQKKYFTVWYELKNEVLTEQLVADERNEQ